jgi:hypothetical protein
MKIKMRLKKKPRLICGLMEGGVGHYLYPKNPFYKDDNFNPEMNSCDFF